VEVKRVPRAEIGNPISEWLGHRIFPTVRLDASSFQGDAFGECPFLSEALKRRTECVKKGNSFGVCTVSASSNGPRQDWLACPYRVISSDLVRSACARIFGDQDAPAPVPATLLQDKRALGRFRRGIQEGGAGYVYFQARLGGEISVPATSRSPEIAFDATIAEVRNEGGRFVLGRYGILEIQTMDFHGSYRQAVENLKGAHRLHESNLAAELQKNPRWAAAGIEGPNIANVFKRTFYQVMIKFQLAAQGRVAGTVLALPQAVWDSWQPFLGAPSIDSVGAGLHRIRATEGSSVTSRRNAFITVFDLDSSATESISPVQIRMHIQVDAEQLAHHALEIVPAGILQSLSDSDSILERIRERLMTFWPDLESA